MARGEVADWLTDAQALQADTVALRRAIHVEPELGLDTDATFTKVMAALEGLPLRLVPSGVCAGLIATLDTGRPGRTILFRGDMDALPITEDTGLDFRSATRGAMHACGHDAHTAMLASAARLIARRRDDLSGRIHFMFQPGEEIFAGARLMLAEGLLDAEPPDAAFALHVFPNHPAGVIVGRAGAALASSDAFDITVTGAGGHGGMPHRATDPIPAACEIVTALQAFVSRRINAFDPAIVTVGVVEAGTARNVIPSSVRLGGTVRAMSEATRGQARVGVEEVAVHVARAHGCTATVEFLDPCPPTVNNADAVAFAEATIRRHLGAAAWDTQPAPIMAADDVSYLLQRSPGAMLFLGVCPEGQELSAACPCHSDRMVINEAALPFGVAAYCALAEAFLNDGFQQKTE
jgi:hippurate hydrolase